jgi:hypothetical protein
LADRVVEVREAFFAALLRVVFFALVRFFLALARFGGGTFAPLERASLRPIAIACLSSFTFCPVLLLRVPFFLRRIADSTLFEAALPYFAMSTSVPLIVQSGCRSTGYICSPALMLHCAFAVVP